MGEIIAQNMSSWLELVYCLLGSSPASECYKPMFRNTVSVPSPQVGRCEWSFTPTHLWRWNRYSVPKCQLITFRRRGSTQKTIYYIHNTAKVWKLTGVINKPLLLHLVGCLYYMLTHIGTKNPHTMCLTLCNQCNNSTISRVLKQVTRVLLRMVQYAPKHVGEIW
jgi:5-methylcytosine-specific restriction endonuclease McrA